MTKRNAPARKFLGDYRITDEVASSATSRIFLGETISSPRQSVAIKWLYTTHLDSQQEEGFRQETRLLQQLRHPSILPLITARSDKGVPYLVTLYAPNGSLDKSMHYQAHLPWPQERALMIISQIGQALYYAHQQNIVHCNLKPQNILFNAQGQALLADFHLTSLPESLHVSASTTYMAPEELLGEINKECDQYALGCLAYEMLTGHAPYHASSLYYPGSRRRLPTLVAPTQFNPLLSPHVEQAILKALAPEPDLRHNDIQAFLDALGTPTEHYYPELATAAPIRAQTRGTVPLLESVNYRRNSPSRPKTYIFKQKKILLALSCILLFTIIISALYLLVITQSKQHIQPTPTAIQQNQSIITTTPTSLVTPSIALSPMPTVILQPAIIQPLPTLSVTTQPLPTQPLVVQPSPTSISPPPAPVAPAIDITRPTRHRKKH